MEKVSEPFGFDAFGGYSVIVGEQPSPNEPPIPEGCDSMGARCPACYYYDSCLEYEEQEEFDPNWCDDCTTDCGLCPH